MKVKKFVTISMLVVAMGLVAGCHYKSSDRYRSGSGYESSYSTYRDGYGRYREGYRDGRTAERRRDAWRDSRYGDRDDWRGRW
jgi:hypothetical protein